MRSSYAFAKEIRQYLSGNQYASVPALMDFLDHEMLSYPVQKDGDKGDDAQSLIDAERRRQDEKWGEQNHDPQVWMAILGEEFGELCQAANDLRWPKPDELLKADPFRHALVEAVQTAAVAKAIVECLLRGRWRWPQPASKYDAAKRYMLADGFGFAIVIRRRPEIHAHWLYLGLIKEGGYLTADGDACEAFRALAESQLGITGLKVEEVPHA